MRAFGILLVLMTVMACNQPSRPQPAKYQIAISPSGQVYRLDVITGGVTAVETTGRLRLTVGAFYEDENGQVWKYAGGGKLEARPSLSSFEGRPDDPLRLFTAEENAKRKKRAQ
jgi:hypothetical protein